MDVLDLLDNLRRQKEEIERTIRVLESASGLSGPKTQWDFVKLALDREKAPLTTRGLFERIVKLGYTSSSGNPITVLSTNLRTFQKKGLIVRMGKGLWGLQEWQKSAQKKLAKAARA